MAPWLPAVSSDVQINRRKKKSLVIWFENEPNVVGGNSHERQETNATFGELLFRFLQPQQTIISLRRRQCHKNAVPRGNGEFRPPRCTSSRGFRTILPGQLYNRHPIVFQIGNANAAGFWAHNNIYLLILSYVLMHAKQRKNCKNTRHEYLRWIV